MKSEKEQTYPERLLPKSNYKLIDNESLACSPSLMLVRHIEGKDVIMGDTGILSPSSIVIQSDHLRDLSNNLLGTFQVDDVKYGVSKECGNYDDLWNPNDEIHCPKEGEYFYDETRRYYFIPISELMQCDGIEKDETVWKFRLFHTPTRRNFWHVSIRLINEEGLEVSQTMLSKNKKNKIWKAAKDLLVSQIVKIKEQDYLPIPESAYLSA